MLDTNSKKLLKLLNSLADDEGCIGNNELLSNNMLTNYNPTKLIKNLRYLQDLEYLNFYSNLANEVDFLQLSHKGINYNNFEWVEVKRFIVRSIIVPIIVSFFTTLLTKNL